ncbi:unnamed protein product [Arctogadus glacialis]
MYRAELRTVEDPRSTRDGVWGPGQDPEPGSQRAVYRGPGLRRTRSTADPVYGGPGLRRTRSTEDPVYGGPGLPTTRSTDDQVHRALLKAAVFLSCPKRQKQFVFLVDSSVFNFFFLNTITCIFNFLFLFVLLSLEWRM